MNLDIQFKINNDSNLKRYLRENSYWYKYLNRDPNNINLMINEMKERYKLRPADKFEKILDNISMFQTFLNVLK